MPPVQTLTPRTGPNLMGGGERRAGSASIGTKPLRWGATAAKPAWDSEAHSAPIYLRKTLETV